MEARRQEEEGGKAQAGACVLNKILKPPPILVPMGWRELLAAAGPVLYVLLGLSLYGVYLLLYGLFLLRREGRVEPGVAEGLAHLAQLAPLVGLLGTTFGMIRAFLALGGEGSSAHLARGIAEALVNTGLGLLVAVVSYAGYAFFSGRRDERP